MVQITFQYANGDNKIIDVQEGYSIMEGAVKNNIDGIDADCGGACACATCHIYFEEKDKQIFGTAKPAEEDMLDFAFDVRPTSRLSCQIQVTPEMDGIVIHVPDKQF